MADCRTPPPSLRAALFARVTIDGLVAEAQLAEVVAGAERQAGHDATRRRIAQLVDDFCGNRPPRWPRPWPWLHVVLDSAGGHKTTLIRDWLAKRPRWHLHCTPTSASWLNQVERFFGSLTERALRRGVHRSTAQLSKPMACSELQNQDTSVWRCACRARREGRTLGGTVGRH